MQFNKCKVLHIMAKKSQLHIYCTLWGPEQFVTNQEIDLGVRVHCSMKMSAQWEPAAMKKPILYKRYSGRVQEIEGIKK